MIHVLGPGEGLIRSEAWDYPVEELDYLMEEHDGEAFVLLDGRLWEAESGPYAYGFEKLS